LVLANLIDEIAQLPEHRRYGRVTGVLGMLLEAGGVPQHVAIGGRCDVLAQDGRRVPCEVVGFRGGRALLMPFGSLDGIGLGCKAEVAAGTGAGMIYPHVGWLGRVINAMGEPIDGKGPLPLGRVGYRLRNSPPPAHMRKRVQGKVDPRRPMRRSSALSANAAVRSRNSSRTISVPKAWRAASSSWRPRMNPR
jgi:flagellum-specific ATP synthase